MQTLRSILAAAGTAAAVSTAHAQFVEPTTIVFSLTGDQPGAGFGWALADTSDLDGDGANDLIIGEQAYFAAPTDPFPKGRVTVVSGRTGATLFEFVPEAGGRIGFAVSSAGDIDGDGVDDVLGGAPFRGATTPAGFLPFMGAVEVYSGADGSPLLTVTAPVLNQGFFGAAVADAGDVDDDGTPDLLVGAPFDGQLDAVAGRAFVISGADGAVIREYEPSGAQEEFGAGTANAGDIDGDGADDHIIGAARIGKAYLFSGASGALLAEFIAPRNTGRYGEFFVDGLNDLNADGVRDIYVGDYAFDFDAATGLAPGAVFVYCGSTFELLYQLDGPAPDSGLGPGRGAGDLDRDGREDLVIGQYTDSSGAQQGGRITAYSGADGSELLTITGTIAGAQLGFDAVGIGDVDGDGGDDLALS
ncbi:MAG: integrin alpha, partial [Planctomycetota bacterium]